MRTHAAVYHKSKPDHEILREKVGEHLRIQFSVNRRVRRDIACLINDRREER